MNKIDMTHQAQSFKLVKLWDREIFLLTVWIFVALFWTLCLARYDRPGKMQKVRVCWRINNLKLYCLNLPKETLFLLDAGYKEKSVRKKDHNFSSSHAAKNVLFIRAHMSGDLLLHLPQGFMKRDIFATKRLLYKAFIFDCFEDFLFKCNIVTPLTSPPQYRLL